MIFILDKQQRTVGVANNTSPLAMPYFKDAHTESLEDVSTYSFSVPASHKEADLLEVEGHIILKDLDGNGILFTIKEIAEGSYEGKRTKDVFCENTAVTELLSDVQRPLSINATSLTNSVNTVMANSSGWNVGIIEDDGWSADFVIDDYMTVLEALQKIKEDFHVELYYTVDLIGTKLTNKKVNFVKQRGSVTNVRFDYSYDLRGVGRTVNSEQIVTALVAVGKGDDNSERINLSTLAAFDDGDFYHENSTDWIGSRAALNEWGLNGKHRFGIFVDDESDTQPRLKQRAIDELKDRCKPVTIYSAAVTTLERITGYESKRLRLGDTIVINDKSYTTPITISGRVQELVRSYTDPTQDTVDLGNYKPLALQVDPKIKAIQQKISQSEAKWNSGGLSEEEVGGIVDDKVGTIVDDKVSQIEVGAVNLIDKTDFKVTPTAWNGATLSTIVNTYPNTIRVKKPSGASYGFSVYGIETFKTGKKYTLSFEALLDGTIPKINYCHIRGDGVSNWRLPDITVNTTETAKFVKYSITFVPTMDFVNGGVLVGVTGTTSDLQIKKVKIEEGGIATAWSRSTNDVNTDISTTKSTADTAKTTADTAKSTADTAKSTADTANSTVNEVKEQIVYRLEISSTKGDQFVNGVTGTTLVATAYKGKENITSTLPALAFIWKKQDSDGYLDLTWTNARVGIGRSIDITMADVNSKAVFSCELDSTYLT
ncbi:phage tail spike protein [Priestia megaterium]